MTPPKKRAVFLDRDGTLNIDPGYLRDPHALELFPGVGDALFQLKQAGFLLVVVSNQSGIARGLILPQELDLVHQRLGELLKKSQVGIDHFELCTHHPDQGCECRKPKPQLLLAAAEYLNVDLSSSYMVGDKESDVHAGLAAGCRGSLLVRTGEGANTEKKLSGSRPHFIGDTLAQVVGWILSQETLSSWGESDLIQVSDKCKAPRSI